MTKHMHPHPFVVGALVGSWPALSINPAIIVMAAATGLLWWRLGDLDDAPSTLLRATVCTDHARPVRAAQTASGR